MKISGLFPPIIGGLIIIGCENYKSVKDDSDIKDSIITSTEKFVKKQSVEVEYTGFEDINIAVFKEKLAIHNNKLSPKEIISLYYPAVIPGADDSYQKIEISSRVDGDKTIVTLIHDNQPHIVIQGHRIVMTLTKNESKWEVISIKQQFKCWLRKDGVVWGTDRCS